jgi:hypothetical protein
VSIANDQEASDPSLQRAPPHCVFLSAPQPVMRRAAAVAASAAAGRRLRWPRRQHGVTHSLSAPAAARDLSSFTHGASSGTVAATPRVRGESHWAEDIRRTGRYGICRVVIQA